MIGSSNLVFSTMTAECCSGHKPVHCCLPSGHRQPIFLALAAPSHAQLQHTLGGLRVCTCVSAWGVQIAPAPPLPDCCEAETSLALIWPLLGLVAAVLWAGHLCLCRLYWQSWARAEHWDPGRLCPNCVAPSPEHPGGRWALCSALAAAWRLQHLPRFPSGRWIFPVPWLSVCLSLCSAPGSPPVPAMPHVLPCSTQSIWQFPWWQAAQEPELE